MEHEEYIVKHCFFNEFEVNSRLKQKRKLGLFINDLIFHYRKKGSQVSYTFVDDEFLYEMNVSHLKHNTYTDIITFDLTEKKSPHIVADIYISVDRVLENASIEKTNYQLELLRVIIHGALHISGFGDNTKAKKLKMRALEQHWMDVYVNQLKNN